MLFSPGLPRLLSLPRAFHTAPLRDKWTGGHRFQGALTALRRLIRKQMTAYDSISIFTVIARTLAAQGF